MRTIQDYIKKEIKDAEAVIYETKSLLETLKQDVNELELKLEFKEQLVEVLKRNLDGQQNENK